VRPSDPQGFVLDRAEDLELFGGRISHITPPPPGPRTLFLSRRFSSIILASAALSWPDSLRSTDVVTAGFTLSIPGQALFPRFQEFLAPPVIQILVETLTPAQFDNPVLTA
jgi:hypothetical protein